MSQRIIQRVKGTQDFLDLKIFNYFLDAAKKHLLNYHFQEISTPILEPTELFKRSLGLETDVVSKEMYLVKTNEEEDESICLRPEMTASTVRSFINGNIESAPWKVFSHGSVFRHERPQKGRYREFHQLNMEIIGSSDISQDAQFIKMLDRFFHETLNLNSYALLVNFLGCADDRLKYKDKLHAFLEKNKEKICANCTIRKEKNIMRVFDCKVATCQELYKTAPYIADNMCEQCNKEWQQLQNYLQELSVSFSYMPTLVRGLDYYNKTVFEFSSNVLGAQNAFCGGGRYDQLVGLLGGKEDQPSIGAAIGIERISLMLEQIANNLTIKQEPKLHVVLPLSANQKSLALLIADELHAANLCTDVLLDNDSIKSMMRKTNKMGATYAIILGEDEQANRQATVKNMINGQEVKLAQSELIDWLNKN